MNSARLVLATLSVILGTMSTCPVLAVDENEAILGKLGKAQISASEMHRLINFQGKDAKAQLSDSLSDLDRLVRHELLRKSLLVEAKEKGWEKKADVQFLMARAKEQAIISAYVQQFTQPPADFPPEEMVKAAYEQNKANLVAPAQYQIASIFISSGEGDKAKAEAATKKAADITEKLKKDPNQFAQLAKEHSEIKATAAKGGEMGWVTDKQIIPELREQLEKLEKGAVAEPVKAKGGWSFVRLLDKKPAKQRTLEESRKFLVSNLRLRKAQESERAYLEGVLQKAPITINDAEMTRMQAALGK